MEGAFVAPWDGDYQFFLRSDAQTKLSVTSLQNGTVLVSPPCPQLFFFHLFLFLFYFVVFYYKTYFLFILLLLFLVSLSFTGKLILVADLREDLGVGMPLSRNRT